MKENNTTSRISSNRGVALGVALGSAFGIIFDNLGVGIALGVALGAALDNLKIERLEKDSPES